MHHIGIVDDDERSRDLVLHHLRRFQDEHDQRFTVRVFGDGADLVRDYPPDLDVLFLDVEMPGMGGFEAAHAVRELDDRVVIVFVTRMAQLAIRGYEVGALSYLVKPLGYAAFEQQLTRCLRQVRRSAGTHGDAASRAGLGPGRRRRRHARRQHEAPDHRAHAGRGVRVHGHAQGRAGDAPRR